MDMNDDELLNNFCYERNLKEQTKSKYRTAINRYCEFCQMPLTELLKEAELEEENGIRWKNRTLKKRLIDFRTFLLKDFNISTVKTYFNSIKAIYNHYEIEVHKLPPVSTKNVIQSEPTTFDDLPTKELIRKGLNIANPLMVAVILHISSTGMGRQEVINLTIADYFKSLEKYFSIPNDDPKDIRVRLYQINEELNRNNNNLIIPTYKLKRQKTNKYYYTFCTPESLNATNSYLLQRTDRLSFDSKLFKVNIRYLNVLFEKINYSLGLGKKGDYIIFRPHMLRKFHATYLNQGENALTKDKIDYLQGRGKTSTTQASYFFENIDLLKKEYIKAIDKIMILQEVKTLNMDSAEVLTLKQEHQKLLEENKRLKNNIKQEAYNAVQEILKKHGF